MAINACNRTWILALMLCLPAATALADKAERDLTGFRAIAVSGGIDLEVHQGDHYKVVVHADGGDADEVETEVEDHGVLAIRKAGSLFHWFNWFNWFQHYKVDVTLPTLQKLTASGGSGVVFESDFTGDELELRASGGGNLRFKGKLKSLDITGSGGSDLYLKGSAHLLTATASGGSDLHAADFEVDEADLKASGGSDMVVNVREKLSARASGGSDIRYEGHPQQTDVKTSGGSDIKARR